MCRLESAQYQLQQLLLQTIYQENSKLLFGVMRTSIFYGEIL